MLEMKNGFVITDDDCMQCRKDLGDRKFLFVQAIWMDGCDEYCVVANLEDLKEMSLDDIEMAICGFYDSLKAMEESYNLPLGQLTNSFRNVLLKIIHIAIGIIKANLLHESGRKKLFRSSWIQMVKYFWKNRISENRIWQEECYAEKYSRDRKNHC